jgi:hypothetical protein
MTATSKCMLRVLLNYILAKFLNCFLTLENKKIKRERRGGGGKAEVCVNQ